MQQTPKWQYDERKFSGVNFADISEVQAYDERMSKIRDVETESKSIIKDLALPPSATLLEVGAGTGAFSLEAANCCAKVIALDVSVPMLEYAKSKALAKGLQNLDFIQAGFLSYAHRGEQFDAVVSQFALHHLPDFWKLIALKNLHCFLKTGGKFYLRDIVFSFNPDHYATFFDQWVDGLRQAAGAEIAADTETSIRDEYYTCTWIMEGLITRAGFSILKKEYVDGFMAVYLCQK
jgi:ubiquinone/menaquinone biosynthesis C-methylase UbiE